MNPTTARDRRGLGPANLVTLLVVLAVASIDVSPLHVYRYLLVSDVLVLAALGLEAAHTRRWTVYAPVFVMVLFTVYAISTGTSLLRPLNPGLGIPTWVHSMFLMLVYVPAVTTLFVRRPDLRRRVVPTLIASMTVQSLVVIRAVAGGLNWQTGTRITGAFGSMQLWPYQAAVVGICAVLMAGTRPWKAWATLSLGAIAAVEFFLRSRMLWVATLLSVGLFVFAQARRKGAAVLSVALLVAALVLGYRLEIYPAAVQLRIAATLRPTEASDLQARLEVVRSLSAAIVESPVLGIGIGQSSDYAASLPVPPLVVNVHNVVMHAAVEGGAGAAAAIAMLPVALVLLWVTGWRAHPDPENRLLVNWAGACLVGAYLAAQLTPTLYEHTFYLLLGLSASLAYVPRKASGRAVEPHAVT